MKNKNGFFFFFGVRSFIHHIRTTNTKKNYFESRSGGLRVDVLRKQIVKGYQSRSGLLAPCFPKPSFHFNKIDYNVGFDNRKRKEIK